MLGIHFRTMFAIRLSVVSCFPRCLVTYRLGMYAKSEMGRFAFIRRYTRTALRGTKLETSENNTGMERLVCQKDNSE